MKPRNFLSEQIRKCHSKSKGYCMLNVLKKLFVLFFLLFRGNLLIGQDQIPITIVNDTGCTEGPWGDVGLAWNYCPGGWSGFTDVSQMPPHSTVILYFNKYAPQLGPGNNACSFGIVFCKLVNQNVINGGITYLSDCTGCATSSTNTPDSSDGQTNCDNSSSSSCSSCGGMPVWSVSQPYVSLWLYDEPLGYQPAIGPRISFKLGFKQREQIAGYNTNIFSVGKKWNFSWLSYVALDANGNNMVRFPGGMQQTFLATNSNFNPPSVSDYLTMSSLSGSTNLGFTITFPDGSQNIYGFIVTNSSGNFQEAFLTQMINPQGQQTILNYYSYNNVNPVVRLQSVVDGDGRTNWVYYNSVNSYSTNLISQVVDPFGRTNFLAYDGNGHLTNSTDVEGISSSFLYDANDIVTNLTTPYGTTSFATTDSVSTPNGRSVLVTQPDGGHQLYLYEDGAPGVPAAYSPSLIPNTSSFGFTDLFDTNLLNIRNTFYWGPRQYANLSTTTISSFTANDFLKAKMDHWLGAGSNMLGETISMERDPSPDNAGTIQGQLTWYDYAGKSHPEYQGVLPLPLCVGCVLPDGTTAFTWTDRNTIGNPIDQISTYSANGSIALRTNLYSYDSSGVDLITTTNAIGVQVSSNAYNAFNEVVTNFNALGEMTTSTYDGSQRLTSTKMPNGLVTSNFYGSDDFLARQIVTGYSTNMYFYSNDLVFAHTDTRGLSTTNIYDNLNRLVSTIYPDGSCISNQYTALDLTAKKDRMGNWTYYGYDSMRRRIAVTNANDAVMLYDYCTCGSLDSIQDALGNVTHFNYDNQGNSINTIYPDGYSTTNAYDLMRRIIQISDNSGNNVTKFYNNQSLLGSVSNLFGQLKNITYDALDRPTNSIDRNDVSINTSYDNLNRVLGRGYPDGGVESFGYTFNISYATSYTNQIGNVILYNFDGLQRETNDICLGVATNVYTYNGAGDLIGLIDGKKQVTTWMYDSFGRMTNKINAAGTNILFFQYDADNRLTNRWTPAKGNTGYSYDAVGNLTGIIHPISRSIVLSYDALNHVTNMIDAAGTNAFTYDQMGHLLSAGGLWPNDTVSYLYTNALKMELSLAQPGISPWTQFYNYDSMRRLISITSQAGAFSYTYITSQPSTLVSQLVLPNGAYINNDYDSVSRLTETTLNRAWGTPVESESYTYDQAGERLTESNLSGDSRGYGYDKEGELISAKATEAGGTPNRLNEQFGYGYDAAGNVNFRTNNGFVQYFNVNNINELTTITNKGKFTVAGTTTASATNVTVNLTNAFLYADSTFAVTNFALANGSNTFTAIGKDSFGNKSTNVVIAVLRATNTYSYDLNGNLLGDGTRNFKYDDENQLIGIWVSNAWSNCFTYDGKMRRRIEQDYTWQTGAWVQTNEIHFIYDGNLVLQERSGSNSPSVTYTRGNDLSGNLQQAGGIGGLLAATVGPGTNYYYHCDGNGNITSLIDTNQFLAAKYLYDPYGNTLSIYGPFANANKYRFSSKEWNDHGNLYYYRLRFYDPNLQRWLNQDPLQEEGGFNLFQFVDNRPTTIVDAWGLSPFSFYGFDRQTFENHINPNNDTLTREQLDLGCIGLCMAYQQSGCPYRNNQVKPELARGTKCYLTESEARAYKCPSNKKPFVFGVYGNWQGGNQPTPALDNSVPNNSIQTSGTGVFNYVTTFDSGNYKYAWMNNDVKSGPQEVDCSSDQPYQDPFNFSAHIWCVTCKCP